VRSENLKRSGLGPIWAVAPQKKRVNGNFDRQAFENDSLTNVIVKTGL
jgi:acyl-CoA synthetase (NDP forming)